MSALSAGDRSPMMVAAAAGLYVPAVEIAVKVEQAELSVRAIAVRCGLDPDAEVATWRERVDRTARRSTSSFLRVVEHVTDDEIHRMCADG